MKNKLVGIFLASTTLMSSSTLLASGFQISESTVAGLGRAFAGAGVAGDDASDGFYNPAGLFQTEGIQFQIGATYINSTSDFNNKGSSIRVGQNTFPQQGGDADGGTDAVVPNLYYIQPLTDNIKFGFSLTSPFGLRTDYTRDWVGRYHAKESELKTIDLNPSLAYKVTDKLAIGAGVSFQYADATLSQAQFTGTPADAYAKLKGDDWGYGFNLGVTYEPFEKTRLGVGFRSKVEQRLEGHLTVEGPDGSKQRIPGKANLDLPETVYISAAQGIGEKLELFTSARFTNWSRFRELRVKLDSGLPDSVTEENWDDSWTLSVGGNYKVNDFWTVRLGYAYDESPVSKEFRTPRIPDTDRHWATIGTSFNFKNMAVDVGYAHLFSDGNSAVSNNINLVSTQPGAAGDTLEGNFTGYANIVGIQFRMEL